MNKINRLLMVLILSMFCFSCSSNNDQIANPWTIVDSIKEASTMTNFDFIVPEEINGNKESLVQVMNDELIEVRYGKDIIIRKARGNEDISGDYNSYEIVKEETISYVAPNATDEIVLTLKGNDDTFNLITWTYFDYSYSISSNDGLSLDVILDIVSSIVQSMFKITVVSYLIDGKRI